MAYWFSRKKLTLAKTKSQKSTTYSCDKSFKKFQKCQTFLLRNLSVKLMLRVEASSLACSSVCILTKHWRPPGMMSAVQRSTNTALRDAGLGSLFPFPVCNVDESSCKMLLTYSWFTSCVNFCCTVKWFSYTYIFFFIFFSIMVYYKRMNILPCAMQLDLVYSCYI